MDREWQITSGSLGGEARYWREPTSEPAGVARILIVDDDERNAFAASQALEPLGQELVVAHSGEEALRRLLTEDYAVILLDLHMPGMDGYETAELIRMRKRNRDTPIVFLTAVFRDEAHLFKAYSAGAVDVVFKPVDPFVLRSKVAVLVDLHLKTVEVERQAEESRRLLIENAKVHQEKLSAEKALRKSLEQQEAILRTLPIVLHARTVEPPFTPLYISGNVRQITGFGPEDFLAEPGFGASRIHPEDVQKVTEAVSGATRTGFYSCEFRWLCADGSYRTLLDQGVLAPGQDGEPREIFGTIIDNTDKRMLEEQLNQARKMEAVGQLTGGVAHDFNNLLTVVLGNVDMILPRVAQDERTKRQLSAVRHAAERGQALTKQLLAFSRRQHLSPVTVDLNELIKAFTPLLQQAVGDSVMIDTKLSGAPLPVHVDAAHLESALLNLAVNARDAMPEGGTLTIATGAANAAAVSRLEGEVSGEWTRLEVRDTGVGMDQDLVSRIFEPFFTTKEVGKGSGLGLSQVYGFVRQSGGQVTVKSEAGKGTAFELFLPLSAQAAAEHRKPPRPPEPVGGSERILVVEDDPAVLALTVEMLQGLGYDTVTASDAHAALQKLRNKKRVDLLFSDVIMPGGMSGIQLAEKALEVRPGLKVLLTSGYVGDKSVSETRFPLIDKPYDRPSIAARLRELLDGDEPMFRDGAELDALPLRAAQ